MDMTFKKKYCCEGEYNAIAAAYETSVGRWAPLHSSVTSDSANLLYRREKLGGASLDSMDSKA